MRRLERSALVAITTVCLQACLPSVETDPALDTPSGFGGGSAGAGGTGTSTGGSGGAGASAAAGGAGGVCTEEHVAVTAPQVDIVLLLDVSGSMADNGKWAAVTAALDQFVASPTASQLAMGLILFPTAPAATPATLGDPCTTATAALCAPYDCIPNAASEYKCACDSSYVTTSSCTKPSTSCVASDYATPVVPVQTLATAGNAIRAAIPATPTGDNTPMGPALEGAIDYAQSWATANPNHETVIVLATDGEPTGCNPNRVDTVAARAAQGLSETPSIRTFVIGIGDQLQTLDDIAVAGGTEQAFIFSGVTGTGASFLDALSTIPGAVTCEFPYPTQVDLANVFVEFVPEATGQGEPWPRRDDESQCGTAHGWYIDNPDNPSTVTLCPSSCARTRGVPGELFVVSTCP